MLETFTLHLADADLTTLHFPFRNLMHHQNHDYSSEHLGSTVCFQEKYFASLEGDGL
jgi:hypothetical protein